MEATTHVVNEQLKRIEPVSKKCSYCHNGIVHDKNDCYYVPIFKTNDRTNIIVYRSVKYSKIDIGIPRCLDCKEVHQKAKQKAMLIAIPAAIAVFAFMGYNFLNFHAVVSVALTFGSMLTGFVGFGYLQNVFSRKAGISTLKEGANSDSLVQDFLTNGWTLTPPSA